jgi:hypothetical protein
MLSVIVLFLFACTGKGDDSSDTASSTWEGPTVEVESV